MATSHEQSDEWRKDPSNWVWGIFYYNKEDKRLLPPKKYKWMGWTTNFANGYSVLFMVALIGAALALGYFYKK